MSYLKGRPCRCRSLGVSTISMVPLPREYGIILTAACSKRGKSRRGAKNKYIKSYLMTDHLDQHHQHCALQPAYKAQTYGTTRLGRTQAFLTVGERLIFFPPIFIFKRKTGPQFYNFLFNGIFMYFTLAWVLLSSLVLVQRGSTLFFVSKYIYE